MFERRKQICSGHKGQFDEACAQVNVTRTLLFFTNLKCSLENLVQLKVKQKLVCFTLIEFYKLQLMYNHG